MATGDASAGRARLIRDGALEVLGRKLKRLVRAVVEGPGPAQPEEAQVQLLMHTQELAFASVVLPGSQERSAFGRVLSGFEAGDQRGKDVGAVVDGNDNGEFNHGRTPRPAGGRA